MNKVLKWSIISAPFAVFILSLFIDLKDEKQTPVMIPKPIPTFKVEDLPVIELTREELMGNYLGSINYINSLALPFDEPIHEKYGVQEDGKLRPNFFQAYYNHKKKYTFNSDIYYVYGFKDKVRYPLIPQVCADYIVDVIDYSLGNWYSNSVKIPQKTKGNFSIREDAKTTALDLRRIPDLIEYFKQHPDYFEFIYDGIGPEIGNAKQLKQWFKEKDTQLGDIVVVSGKVPWSPEQHSHSFIVSKLENGLVKKVSGNAGTSKEWSLEEESYRTPHRTARYVVRLKNNFLKLMLK